MHLNRLSKNSSLNLPANMISRIKFNMTQKRRHKILSFPLSNFLCKFRQNPVELKNHPLRIDKDNKIINFQIVRRMDSLSL